MNKTAVIVWSIAIVLCFLLGLIGFLNRGLLKTGEDLQDTTTAVQGNTELTRVCTKEDADHKVTYKFTLDANNYVSSVAITYNQLTANTELYNKAVNLKADNVSGLVFALSGNEDKFNLLASIKLDEFDNETFSDYQDSYREFDMLLDKNTDYATYSSSLSGFTCN